MSMFPQSFVSDPYGHFLQQQKYRQNLIHIDKSSKFAKKIEKLKHGLATAKGNMLNGAMMGFMIGGLFGLAIGIYSAFQTRRLITIPMSILVSGVSFGFILGCGSVIRNDEINTQNQNNQHKKLFKDQWLTVYNFNKQNMINTQTYY